MTGLQYPALLRPVALVGKWQQCIPCLDVLWIITVQRAQMVRKLPRYTDVHFNAQTPAP